MDTQKCSRCKRTLPTQEFSGKLCHRCLTSVRKLRDQPTMRRRILLSRIKTFASKHGVPFNLTLDDIIIPTHCPVLGIPLEFGKMSTSTKWRENSPSLDRIIPDNGYVRGNVIVVSYRANRIKNDATVQELIAVSRFYEELTNARVQGVQE